MTASLKNIFLTYTFDQLFCVYEEAKKIEIDLMDFEYIFRYINPPENSVNAIEKEIGGFSFIVLDITVLIFQVAPPPPQPCNPLSLSSFVGGGERGAGRVEDWIYLTRESCTSLR